MFYVTALDHLFSFRDLITFAYEWNNHRMRQSRMAEVPGGTPEILFHMPHSQGTQYNTVQVLIPVMQCNGTGHQKQS